jgi:sec-independent protein translocase protein TatC
LGKENSEKGNKLPPGKEAEMTFLEHLEELRWRILYAVIGIVIGTIVSWIFIDMLVEEILLIPARKAEINLQNLRPFGQLFLYLQVAFVGGLVLSIPNVFYQIWKFISPALKDSEKKHITAIVIFSSICFLSGIVFAYYVMLPLTLKFAGEFGSEMIENNFAITEYLTIIISVMLGAAIVFELPMLSFFLSKIGILTPAIMRKYRRHAIIGILILAALLTPGTDPIAQVLLAVPLVLLYEISIFVSKIFSTRSE